MLYSMDLGSTIASGVSHALWQSSWQAVCLKHCTRQGQWLSRACESLQPCFGCNAARRLVYCLSVVGRPEQLRGSWRCEDGHHWVV